MSVLITAEISGQTAQGYDNMLLELAAPLRQAPGLILHSSHATDTGWRVIEVWASKAESDRFFASFVAPRLPPGIRPKRSVQALHNVTLPVAAKPGA